MLHVKLQVWCILIAHALDDLKRVVGLIMFQVTNQTTIDRLSIDRSNKNPTRIIDFFPN